MHKAKGVGFRVKGKVIYACVKAEYKSVVGAWGKFVDCEQAKFWQTFLCKTVGFVTSFSTACAQFLYSKGLIFRSVSLGFYPLSTGPITTTTI